MKKLSKWLHRQTVHRKLMLVILTTSLACLIVAGAALFLFSTSAVRANFMRETKALAEIIAGNQEAPLVFGDKEAALQLLETMGSQEHYIGATIFRTNGEVFVAAGTDRQKPEQAPSANGSFWRDSYLYTYATPIIGEKQVIGSVQLTTNFKPTHDRLFRSYLLVFGIVFAGAASVGLCLSAGAKRVISDPIRLLAESVKTVSNSSPGADQTNPTRTSEMDELANAFSAMRERVEAGARLEREVAERRRAEDALRKSEEQFRSLFENAPVGLYRSSSEGRFLMANTTLLRMLGYESFSEIANLDLHKDLCVDPAYRSQFSECIERIGMVEETEVQWRRRDGKIIFVRESAKAIRNSRGEMTYCEGCVEDITTRKEAQAELQRLHRELVDASRAAGMAEVATGVLHNVGNVLNSVNVSATVLNDQLGRSKLASLKQAVELVQTNLPQLSDFLSTDPRGKLLPDFLIKVTQHLADEHHRWQNELRDMKKNIEHMKVIVSMQQNFAKVTGAKEPLAVEELVEDALKMNEVGLTRHAITVEKIFADVPLVMTDKHKVLQILVNLIRNAKHALNESSASEKKLQLKIYKNGSGRVKIQIQDNGVGIPAENLTRIFSHGFTTRPKGHGFGLHSGALAARELGGTLEVQSDGQGQGATFTLELPIAGGRN